MWLVVGWGEPCSLHSWLKASNVLTQGNLQGSLRANNSSGKHPQDLALEVQSHGSSGFGVCGPVGLAGQAELRPTPW